MQKHKTLYRLIELLSDGQFHSGEELGQKLGITRAGVWKASKQLTDYGIELQSVTGKGYCVPQGLELLQESQIKAKLDPNNLADLNELVLLTSTPSTNDYLLDCAKSRSTNTLACLAEHQSNARGRRARQWLAPFGTNIYLSLLWHFDKDPAEMVGLSIAIATAVIKALKQYGIKHGLTVKWPNDILYEGRKLAGILADMLAESHSRCSVVIGLGMNVMMPMSLVKQIDQPWADIAMITQQKPQRNRLAGLLLNEIINNVKRFNQQGLSHFIEQWREFDNMRGEAITLLMPNARIDGIMQDISEHGELIIELADGRTQRYLSGEVSLRLKQ